MAYTQAQFFSALQELAAIAPGDGDEAAIQNSAIDYAEQRIYRELNLLATVKRATTSLTAGSRNLALPTVNGAIFVVVQGINLMLPTGRVALVPKTREFVDFFDGSENPIGTQSPIVYCMLTDQTALVAPSPSAATQIEIVGTVRPTPLYNLGANDSTFLSANLPDLFMAATMVFISGYQKNFGSQADDPKMAMSWEQQYQTLFASAQSEEIHRRFAQSYGAPQ